MPVLLLGYIVEFDNQKGEGGGLSRSFMCLYVYICEPSEQFRSIWKKSPRRCQRFGMIWMDSRNPIVSVKNLLLKFAPFINKVVIFSQTLTLL